MKTTDRLIVDGLIYFCDGDPQPLRAGGVSAANITVAPFHAAFEEAFDSMAMWRERLDAHSGWRLVQRAEDIAQARRQGQVGVIFGWQNSCAIGTRLERVAAFHHLGLRIMQLTYNEGNYTGDGCAERRAAGLSNFGRQLVAELNRTGIIVDLSHCSEATAREAAQCSRKPVLLTHANAKAVNDLPRNKTDETLRLVAESGGVIGLSLHAYMNWDQNPHRQPSLETFVRHARHVTNLVGIDHVGIGTDFAAAADVSLLRQVFDAGRNRYPAIAGAFSQAFSGDLASRYPPETQSPRDFPRILEALNAGGFSDDQIDAIAGLNFLRVFKENWG